jgi:lipopolysaccharide/colanic/teichoic acid biosynthesis glycosyltransferase
MEFLSGASSYLPSRRLGARRKSDRASVRRPRTRHPEVVNEELFQGALVREQRRADRSNLPLALLLVTKPGGFGIDTEYVWNATIESLNAVKRDIDVLGWYAEGETVGVIFPELNGRADALIQELAARARLELGKRLGVETSSTFTIQTLVHPEPKLDGSEPAAGVVALPNQSGAQCDQATVYDALKRLLDVTGALALLALLSPIMLVVATLVKLTSRGPVFFRQVRVGQNMKPFTMLKFRSMHVNANSAIHKEFVSAFIKSSANVSSAGQGAFFKIANDPRVTAIGNILRKTSIDELPQFLNVLRGDMSLVGPRPPLPYEVEQYQRWHCRRVLEAKPGITGLWQVMGRSRTTFDEMVRLDLRYAKSRSLRTDIKILLATPKAVIVGKGAC